MQVMGTKLKKIVFYLTTFLQATTKIFINCMKRVIASYNNLHPGSVSEQLIKTASCGLLRVLVQGELAGREARARAVFLTVSCDWRRAGHVT